MLSKKALKASETIETVNIRLITVVNGQDDKNALAYLSEIFQNIIVCSRDQTIRAVMTVNFLNVIFKADVHIIV